MQRFMGMMPSECIEISKKFKDEKGQIVHIDAGPEGWTILYYEDNSSSFNDVNATSEENFKEAFKVANEVSKLTPVESDDDIIPGECCMQL